MPERTQPKKGVTGSVECIAALDLRDAGGKLGT